MARTRFDASHQSPDGRRLADDVRRALAQLDKKIEQANRLFASFESKVVGQVALRARTAAVLTSDVAAGVNVTGAGGTPNLDQVLGDYSVLSLEDHVNVFVNGALNRYGTSNDMWEGDNPSTGDLRFGYALRAGSVLIMEVFVPVP